jgi:hypothetical protein
MHCYNCAEILSHARVWNYDDALPVNSFQNHKLSDRGLSKLLLINELDESLLLAASSMPLFSMLFLLYLTSAIDHLIFMLQVMEMYVYGKILLKREDRNL